MRYGIYVVGEFSKESISLPKEGFFSIYEKKGEKIYALFYQGRNLTPYYRRGIPLKDLPFLSFLKGLPEGSFRWIRRRDFSLILRKLREINEGGSTLIFLEEETSSWVLLQEDSSSLFFLEKPFFFLPPKVQRVFIIGKKYSSVFSLLLKISSSKDIPVYCFFSSEKRTPFFSQKPFLPIRRILILSNLYPSPLPYVVKEVDFYNRGIPGFYWRHLFGVLSEERIKILLKERWDLILYQGHAEVKEGYIAYPLERGKYFLIKEPLCKFYIHFACLPGEIRVLPGRKNLLPREKELPDRPYHFLMERIGKKFLHRYPLRLLLKEVALLAQKEGFYLWYG